MQGQPILDSGKLGLVATPRLGCDFLAADVMLSSLAYFERRMRIPVCMEFN